MGEKIEDIGEFFISGQKVLIELNEGYSTNYSRYDIHIQSGHIQYCMTNREYIQLATALINARERLDYMKNYRDRRSDLERYIIFGAGKTGKQALDLLGKDKVSFFVDNDKVKQGTRAYGVEIKSIEEVNGVATYDEIIIATDKKFYPEISKQLDDMGILNYRMFNELKYEITNNKIKQRVDFINGYKKAIQWIYNNTIDNEGIICHSNRPKPYPEVSGYYIPTMLRWGHKELAVSYAKWLCDIQHKEGAWYDTENQSPYIFDTAQILKGLIAVRDFVPTVDEHIIKGCDWILSNMTSEGRLASPLKNAWGDGKTYSELIHTYCISPIKEAGEIFDRSDYIEKAERIAHYYTTECKDQILNFDLLSHFYAYVMEAMLDIGREDLAKTAMEKIAGLQKESGAVPAYKNVDWVCSTGLFQLAVVWFRMGDIEHGNKAFEYACKLQNKTGGWYGSYMSEENDKEVNNYFPDSEISWANKYFLDALYYKNLCQFEMQSAIFGDTIACSDGRYRCIEEIVEKNIRGRDYYLNILDIGCGKGRYLKNLVKRFPDNHYFAVDLSSKVMEYFDDLDIIEKKQGTLTDIPFEDGKFDVVYTCEALEHAIDIGSAVRELCRVTKSGGTIAILDKNKDKLGCLEIEEWEQWFDENELKEELFKYCTDVQVMRDISYENHSADGLFYLWMGIKK